MTEAHRKAFFLQDGELGWIVESRNRQMVTRGLKVLTNRDDITSNGPKIPA